MQFIHIKSQGLLVTLNKYQLHINSFAYYDELDIRYVNFYLI